MPSFFVLTLYGIACAAVYRIMPGRIRPFVLLLLSLGFYATRQLTGLPFLLITALTVWFCALRISAIAAGTRETLKAGKATLSPDEKKALKTASKNRQRIWFWGCLLLNFGLLGVFKYADDILGLAGRSPLGLLLPLGISFYTFQSIGYLIDVSNAKYAPEKNFFRFALFVSFFPQLIQGPIGRYDQLADQLSAPNKVSLDDAERAGLLILWGLFKKMVIADRAVAFIESAFTPASGFVGSISLAGVLFYSLQQYCDFSGGIDLVTGIAELFGIRLAPNFKRPYFSVSLGDFWRRWHISLGTWMRDYVFYPFALLKPVTALSKAAKGPLGKNAAKALPAALGNIVVFFLVGLWHGATANYIAWGLYNGLVLAVSALLDPFYKQWNSSHAALSGSKGFYLFRILRTFLIVNIGWFFDRAVHLSDAFRMMLSIPANFCASALSVGSMAEMGLPLLDLQVLAVSTLVLFAVSVLQERGLIVRDKLMKLMLPVRWLLLIGGILLVLLLGMWGSGFHESAFIYYQF